METRSDGREVYVKAVPLRSLSDLESMREELESGNILIVNITPLATRDVEELREAVRRVVSMIGEIGGDIARLGEERLVLTPRGVRIWKP